jgi:hypothetical protein|tara:strand:- start:5415 stop:5678 length:264 start_codon:yes stop_codon:yes gene_type:complete
MAKNKVTIEELQEARLNYRTKMLKIHNTIKDIVSTAEDAKDIWLSDIRKLENIVHTLHNEYDFEPRVCPDTGRKLYYGDWVLAEENK